MIWALGQVLLCHGGARHWKKQTKQNHGRRCADHRHEPLSLVSQAQDATAKATTEVLPNYGGLSATTFWTFLAVILTELLVIFFIMFSIRRIQRELLPEEMTKQMTLSRWWDNLDKTLYPRRAGGERSRRIAGSRL